MFKKRDETQSQGCRSLFRAGVLFRPFDVGLERFGGVEGPVRIAQHRAGEEDGVGLSGRDDFLGVMGIGDQADGAGAP